MDKNTIISTYDAVSKAYAAAFSNPSFHLKDFLDMIKPPARILDIGCGPGNNAAYLSALGYTVVGVDLSENMLALARQKSPGTTFIKQDIAHLDFPESSFDHAVAAYSLCYLPKSQVLSCLKKIHRILKPAGRLFIKIQEGDSAEISCPEPFDASLMMDLNIMSSGEITGLINESGFGVIRTFLDKKDPSDNFAHLNELCLMVQKNESEAA